MEGLDLDLDLDLRSKDQCDVDLDLDLDLDLRSKDQRRLDLDLDLDLDLRSTDQNRLDQLIWLILILILIWNSLVNFRRKLVKIAKSNAQAAIAQALRASHRGGSSLGQRPATL